MGETYIFQILFKGYPKTFLAKHVWEISTKKFSTQKDFVCKHCCEIPPKRTLRKFPGKQIPKHVFGKVCPTRLLPPTSNRFLRKDFTNIPWRYLPKNNFHIPPKGFYLTNISVRYFLKHVFYIFSQSNCQVVFIQKPLDISPNSCFKRIWPTSPRKCVPQRYLPEPKYPGRYLSK